jgi:FKBP-type peptidyl-prolyl cis-trans isomerase 2
MSQDVRSGDVLNHNIVGDDKLFQAGADGFVEGEISFEEKRVGREGDVEIGFESAFGGDNGRANCLAGRKFLKILGDLAVEEAESVGARDAEEGAGARNPAGGR